MPRAPLVLYSTNTWLAYDIAELFFGGEHYVWCTPHFSPRSAPPYASVPPTSCPSALYRSLAAEVRAGDRHSLKIRDNRTGILRGVEARRQDGMIDERDLEEIKEMVKGASVADFRPLLYVIPHDRVAPLVERVPVTDRAHPLAEEFVISRLPRTSFDVIDFED